MNRVGSSKHLFQLGLSLTLLISALCLLCNALFAGDEIKPTPPPPPPKNEKKEKKELNGAELYAINCNRCHPERYPTEFNSTQWKTLMLHMRVRANLPASQAKAIAKYLQEEAGN